jgi:hypothetical protein
MRNKKSLSEYQKQRLGAAIEALKNPIFSTLIIKALRDFVKPFFFQGTHGYYWPINFIVNA